VSVTNGSDELWVGVKCQSNTEIAGSPRNALRCSPGSNRAAGGRALLACGGFTAYQSPANCECQQPIPGVRRRVRTSVVKRATTQIAS
jgi:hypothetical protein